MDSRHGSWLASGQGLRHHPRTRSRQEKQEVGQGRRHRAGGNAQRRQPRAGRTLGGGNPATIISLLTGRQAASLTLGKTARRQQVHNLLADMTRSAPDLPHRACRQTAPRHREPSCLRHLGLQRQAAAGEHFQSLGQQLHAQGRRRSRQRLSDSARPVYRAARPVPTGIHPRLLRSDKPWRSDLDTSVSCPRTVPAAPRRRACPTRSSRAS